MRHLIAATAATILLTGCGVTGNLPFVGKSSPTPSTFNVIGTVTVQAGEGSVGTEGGNCVTEGGFSDIASGGQVTITNESGKVVALGTLDAGRATGVMVLPTFNPETGQIEQVPQATKCVFGFSVPSVPEGENFYAIEMGHRKPLKYTRSELATPLSLTLG